MLLYMTGGGRTSPPGRTGEIPGTPLPHLAADVKVPVGTQDAEVHYAGGAAGLVAGVEQVKFRLSSDAPSGEAVPLSVAVDTNFSRQVTVAIE